jgi:hypothetical protein
MSVCPFSTLCYDRQESAVLRSIENGIFSVRLLSQPRATFQLRPAFCVQFNSVQRLAVYSQLLQRLHPYTLLKLLINEQDSTHAVLSAQVYLCFGCRVNTQHPAGPVLERVDKQNRENYIELGRLLFFSALDELCHQEQLQLCREHLLGRNAERFICRGYPMRKLAQQLYNLLGQQDVMKPAAFNALRRRSQHNAASPLKKMVLSRQVVDLHNRCKSAH